MITITTYQELSDFVAAFGDGHMNMLVICSRGGLGKTETVRRTLDEENIVYIGGHITPLELYAKLHDGRDKPVLFDEIDGMLSEVKHVGLLKQLCETREVKKVMWGSTDRRAAQIDGGAGHFYTRSRVLMLCNSFASFSANVAALKTRGLTIQFLPDSRGIMSKIKTFATDTEIVAFLEHFHECVPDFSLRTYRVLQNLKSAGLDWRRYGLDESKIPPKVREIADLLTRFSNDTERVKHFSGCRRSYYDWKSKPIEHLRRQSLKTLKQEPDGSHNQGIQTESPLTTGNIAEINWDSWCLPEPEPRTREKREAAKLARLEEKERRELEEEACCDTVEAMVFQFAGDPEGLWRCLIESGDPLEVLSLLRDHHDADTTGTDPLLLMETFMETYDYPYASYAKCAIGNVIGHEYMRGIAVEGKSYWPRLDFDLFA